MNTANETTMEMEQFDTLPIPPCETPTLAEPFQLEENPEPCNVPEIFEDETIQQEEADNAPAAMTELMTAAKDADAIAHEEEEKRAAHEAAEAKRKEEWEAKQQAKKAAEEAILIQIASMSDDALIASSMKKIEEDTERLTRRNMKLCVMEWIQTKCLDDLAFARMAMHPKKNMVNCFHYINRKAKDYLQKEMEHNDQSPENGIYGGDVPDELCYQWAEAYFQDPDAKEDRQKKEEFVPRPYYGGAARKNAKPKKADKKTEKAAESKKVAAKENGEENLPGQLSLFDSVQEVSA